ELCALLRGHRRGSADLARSSAALELRRRWLPGALDAVRRGNRGRRYAPRRPARQAQVRRETTSTPCPGRMTGGLPRLGPVLAGTFTLEGGMPRARQGAMVGA